MLHLSVDNYSGCPRNLCVFFLSVISSNVQADRHKSACFFHDWRL